MDFLNEGLLKLEFDKGNFFGIPLREFNDLKEKLNSYIKLLQEYNAKFDLINTDDYDEIVIRHILDSLSAAKFVAANAKVFLDKGEKNLVLADIGSGAGLPGIPLSLAFPSLNFILVERMTKRCDFLNSCKNELSISNCAVEENQVERLEQNRFNICVFRAFRPLEKKMVKVLRRILKPEGKLLAYKAKSEKIEEEMNLLEKNKPEYRVEKLEVPFLTENSISEIRERNLVIIEK